MYELQEPVTAREGTLQVGGVDATALADKFGTPLYVYDADAVRDRYRRVRDAFGDRYGDVRVHYAVKANSNPHIVRVLAEAGAGFDASSPAEVRVARDAGADRDEVLFTGAYSNADELADAREHATLNLDGAALLDRLEEVPDTVSFRVNPGIGRGTHDGLAMGGEDAKFGVPADRIVDAYRRAQDAGVKHFGIHMMTGSGVLDPAYFGTVTERLLDICGRINDALGISFDFLDIGGGLGVPYTADEEPLDLDAAADSVVEALEQGCQRHGLDRPTLLLEPGRYLVAEAGVLLTAVTTVKDAGTRFIGVDAGMHTLLRPALYGAYHRPVLASATDRDEAGPANIVGPICENTDQFVRDEPFPRVESGDIVAFLNAGAYGYGMASNYNTRPLPAEVMVDGGRPQLIRGRQTGDELFDRVPGY